jgi:hypothetical protein
LPEGGVDDDAVALIASFPTGEEIHSGGPKPQSAISVEITSQPCVEARWRSANATTQFPDTTTEAGALPSVPGWRDCRGSRRRATIFITSDAVEFVPQPAPATVLCNRPRTFNIWRIMAHVLIMAAFQLGHPVTFFIAMKSNDLSLHVSP